MSDIPANLEVGLDRNDYFPCGDVKVLAEKLQTIIDEPLRQKEYDMSKYNWEKIADQVAAIYQKFNLE